MADIKDVQKAKKITPFRMAANVFPLMPQFQKRGIELPKTQDTILH